MSTWKLGVLLFVLTAVVVPALDEADAVVPEADKQEAAASQAKAQSQWHQRVAKESTVKKKAQHQAWKAVSSSLSSSELSDKKKAQQKQQEQQQAWNNKVNEKDQKQNEASAKAEVQERVRDAKRAKQDAQNHDFEVSAERAWERQKAKMQAQAKKQKQQTAKAEKKRSQKFIKLVEKHQKEVIQKKTQAEDLKTQRAVADADWNEMMQKTNAANKRLAVEAAGGTVPAPAPVATGSAA